MKIALFVGSKANSRSGLAFTVGVDKISDLQDLSFCANLLPIVENGHLESWL